MSNKLDSIRLKRDFKFKILHTFIYILIFLIYLDSPSIAQERYNPDGKILRPSFSIIPALNARYGNDFGIPKFYTYSFGSFEGQGDVLINLPISPSITINTKYVFQSSMRHHINSGLFGISLYSKPIQSIYSLINPDGIIGSMCIKPTIGFSKYGESIWLDYDLLFHLVTSTSFTFTTNHTYKYLDNEFSYKGSIGFNYHLRNKSQTAKSFNPDGNVGSSTLCSEISFVKLNEYGGVGASISTFRPLTHWLTLLTYFEFTKAKRPNYNEFFLGFGFNFYP